MRLYLCLLVCTCLCLSQSVNSGLVPFARYATHGPVVAPLFPCSKQFLRDPPSHVARAYTQFHQQWSIATRKEMYYSSVLHVKRNPSPEEHVNKGHDPGNLSEEELVQLQKRSLEAQQKAEADLDQLVTIMKAEGIVVQDTTRDSLAGCLVARLDAAHYPERVVASITMQYFKQPEFPHAMVKSLINCNDKVPLELLVNVDHPKHAPIWTEYAKNTSGLVIPVISDNIHEARAFNRLARLARGQVIVSAQDDEVFPESCEWLEKAVKVFHKHPKVGLLGLRRRSACFKEEYAFGDSVWHDAKNDLDFQFDHKVDASPYALRTATYHELGGWDETATAKGECGIIVDWELAMRVWAAGWWVGYLNKPPQTTHTGEANSHGGPDKGVRCWELQLRLAGRINGARWPAHIEAAMCKKALQLNCRLLEMRKEKAGRNETLKCAAVSTWARRLLH